MNFFVNFCQVCQRSSKALVLRPLLHVGYAADNAANSTRMKGDWKLTLDMLNQIIGAAGNDLVYFLKILFTADACQIVHIVFPGIIEFVLKKLCKACKLGVSVVGTHGSSLLWEGV